MQVENPIPFADSALTRGLSILYLHSRYALLLLFPLQLSADWSYSCIPLVESIHDPRNAASAVLYAMLATVLLSGLPFGGRESKTSQHDLASSRTLRYQAFVLLGLLVSSTCPFSLLKLQAVLHARLSKDLKLLAIPLPTLLALEYESDASTPFGDQYKFATST